MNSPQESVCPTPNQLRDYATGRQEPVDDEAITGHLVKCVRCEETVDSFRVADDTLMNVLQKLPPTDQPVDQHLIEPELIARLADFEQNSRQSALTKSHTRRSAPPQPLRVENWIAQPNSVRIVLLKS